MAASTDVFFAHDVPSTVIVCVSALSSAALTIALHASRTPCLSVNMFTDADVRACDKFADTNTKIRTIRLIHRKAPHLASKLTYTVRDALAQDYYIPETLRHACKVVEVSLSKSLCDALSCNPTTENGVCRADTRASYYYVGDDGYDVQCQPACFNTTVSKTYSGDGGRAPDTPMLNYHSGKCRIVPATIVSYLEKTFFRSDTVYEYRKNDMPTGFSRKTAADNPYGCGLDYRTNETYCKYYDRTLQEDGSCGLKWWEKGLDAVVGMQLVNTMKSNVRLLNNGRAPFAAPDGLPDLPAALEPRHTVDGWKRNVDPSFVLPELVDTRPAGGVGSLDSPRARQRVRRDLAAVGTGSGEKEQEEEEESTRKEDWVARMRDVMLGLLEQAFTDRSFWVQTGVGVASQAALDTLRSMCKRIVESLSLSLVKRVPQTVTAVGANVLKTGLKSACRTLVAASVARVASKTAVAVAKVTAAAASVVGWLTMAANLLDVLFTFWDPYGYNNMFPPSLPHDLLVNGERALRRAAGSATLDYEFDNLAALLLSEEEIMSVHLESLRDRIVYLDALTVNGDGVRIDKGPTVNFGGERASLIEEAHARTMVERVRFDPEAYAEYNGDFLARVRINEYADCGALTAMCAAGLCTASGFYLLASLFLLLTLVAFAVARLQLYDDTVLDYVRQHCRRGETKTLGVF